ncbi:MAG: 30S ribosome-binding factor RbfA [Patescibacteria group bacterium]|nr:30S ribosome-binding factor RbfA [Patescibacteria group bacterium]MBU1876744.1 30S ribosome-binding factor RbfA [Patescibacteria group bacterium]
MSRRILRLNELIQKELGQIILHEIEFPVNILVTLTRVDVSSDLGEAKIYISCLPDSWINKAIKILKTNIYDIQQQLNHNLNIRKVPRIIFIEEKQTKEAGRVEELLEKIKRKY